MRARALTIAAGVFAFVFWLPSLALADLAVGLLPAGADAASSHAVGNVAYGILGAVLVAPAFAAHLLRPSSKVAPLQQLGVVAAALAIAALASGASVGVAGAVVVLVPSLVMLALHPARGDVLRRARWRPSFPLAALAVAATVPALGYAWTAAANGRAGLPPEDSYAYVPTVWSAATALALAAVLVAFVASLRAPGWPVPAASVAAAALLFGAASLVNPDVPGSGGGGWGAVAVLWSLTWALVARGVRASRPQRRSTDEKAA